MNPIASRGMRRETSGAFWSMRVASSNKLWFLFSFQLGKGLLYLGDSFRLLLEARFSIGMTGASGKPSLPSQTLSVLYLPA